MYAHTDPNKYNQPLFSKANGPFSTEQYIMTIDNFINTKKSNITRYNKQHTNNKTTLLSSPIMTRKILLLGLVLICIVLQLFTDYLSSLKQQQQQPQQYENKNNNVNDYYYYDEKVAEINDPLKDIMPHQ